MQNFPNSAAPPPPGFSTRGGNMVGSSYQPHISDAQISPRTVEDYAAMQHHQPILQSHNQHLHLRAQPHGGQASHIHGYGPRPQASTLAGSSSNTYRKEPMDYYFSLSGRDRNRRGGGGGYGAGFGYPNMDGHIPHQYRHVPGSVPSSGMMSAYPMDYSTNAAGSGNTGTSSFSPSQQFNVAQNASAQTISGVEMLQRQHTPKYLQHQGLTQGHRVFSMSGHRISSQFGQYAPLGVPTGSAGIYNSPPPRYETSGDGGVDLKITSSPTHAHPNAISGSNTSGHQENVLQVYPSSNHSSFSPQSHSLSKHTPRRTPQHNLNTPYDSSLKMQHPSPCHSQPKNNQSPVSQSPAAPHQAQDISKSPMHSQNQQTTMNQNFSPISNPSPAPSNIHSPSYSSSSSPMGVSENLGNSTSLHSSNLHPRGAHGHARPQHSVAQLSPNPSSNSSISSCGSVVSSATNRMASRAGKRDDTSSSLYSQAKLSQDPGLNSLNALTSQVANLPNTVQHMMLTDTVLSQRKSRENLHQPYMHQTTNQQTPQNAIAAVQASSNEGVVLGSEPKEREEKRNQMEQMEPEKVRQKSGSSTESNQEYYSVSQNSTKTQRHPQLDNITLSEETPIKQINNHVPKYFLQTKEQQSGTPSTSPSAVHFNKETLKPSCLSAHTATPSPAHSSQPNCVIEPNNSHSDDKTRLTEHKSSASKDKRKPVKREEPSYPEELDKEKTVPILTSVKVEDSALGEQSNISDDMNNITKHCLNKHIDMPGQTGGVGVIVSARTEQNSEGPKLAETTSRYGTLPHVDRLNYSEEKHSVNVFKDSASHNGERDMSVESYPTHFVTPKTEYGHSMTSNHCQAGPYKYNRSEMAYNACMGSKIKGRTVPELGAATTAYQDYHQSLSNYGSMPRKDVSVVETMGRTGLGSRGQDGILHLQQPYPSLLQEVLQGYHLDRRYSRSEQASGGPQTMSQHYHTRLPYRMPEDMRPHAMIQSVGGGASGHQELGMKKTQSQNQGPEHEINQSLSHPLWDSETQRHKAGHGGSSERNTINMSPSHSIQILPSVESLKGTPPKHINLADYSLPHRKPPNLSSPPSAVQQLLLQETGPLLGNSELTSQTQSHVSSSSGRRSVICDVSPSRRTSPDKERGQFGSTVIQQSHMSSVSNEQGCGKDDVKIKGEQEEQELSKVHPGDFGRQALEGHSVTDMQRHSAGKEITEPPSNTSYNAHHMHSNPLSSPPRSNPYFKPVEESAGLSLYGYIEGPDRLKTSHNHFQQISSHISQSPNKLQAYPHHIALQHSHGMDNRFDWSSNSNRLKDISTHQSPDQKCKIQTPADILSNQHPLMRQNLHPSPHYEMKMWESFSERDGAANHELHPASNSHKVVNSPSGPKPVKVEVSQDELIKKVNQAGSGGVGNSSAPPGGPRQTKSGGTTETNPLILRRRVRSFISPIPAKRQHQDASSLKGGSSSSPVTPSESRHLNDPASGSADPRTKLTSPNTSYHLSNANSPPLEKTKILPPRKGRGLKLEAIVQKITPNKNANYTNSHGDADCLDAAHYSSDTPDSEIRASYSAEPNREESCLPYLEEGHSLDGMLPYRAEDVYSCDSPDIKQGLRTNSTNTPRKMPTDFDFGLGTAGSSGSGTVEGDKDEFTLLGPLPPPPPLPRPVQGSPPPSSSVLSDIQQFTNTYQQLETRRGEQSAANLLRQKLQETSMGFDDYPGGNFYGATSIHGQSPGHHHLSRTPQHELASARMGVDSKSSESLVPKGYFPSGKKKGRPVGSVNKQKKTQVQAQVSTTSIPAAPHTPPAVGSAAVTPQPESISSPGEEAVTTSALPEQKPCPFLDLTQTQPTKVEMEYEDTQPEEDIKPVKPKQRKGKETNEGSDSKAQPWRKRRVITPKEEQDPPTGVLSETRKNVFSPYIHIENKITEIGAVCSIVNSEGEKSKGGKSGSGVESLSTVSLISQMARKERESERIQETEQDDTVIQSGKSLPTSEYVLPGPVISDSRHMGRLLCCLCQKWANYKNLGDLYGPFYPADYVAKFPKNQPQIRQTSSNSGVTNTGLNQSSLPTELIVPDTQSGILDVISADYVPSQTSNPVSPAPSENMSCLSSKIYSTDTTTPAQNWEMFPGVESPAHPVLEFSDLTNEIIQRKQQKVEDLQQRPQHRKLTSHPRFKRRHKSGEILPRTVPINSKASLPFQPPPPTLNSLGPLAQLAQLPLVPLDPSELWVHESCIAWTSGVYLVNGRLYGLQEAFDGARETVSYGQRFSESVQRATIIWAKYVNYLLISWHCSAWFVYCIGKGKG